MRLSAREMGVGGEPVVFLGLLLGFLWGKRQAFTHFSTLSKNLESCALGDTEVTFGSWLPLLTIQFAKANVDLHPYTYRAPAVCVRRAARCFASVPVLSL